ncbi:MAG: SpoIID/LytB domain-containing protein [Firmicutes bacterium]|nr:SpoIID/LytB domain-containing protein [Bacillota bacterium]
MMFYDGKLIVANYMANAGGHTENGANVWGGNSPYLQGIRCPWDAYPYVADTGSYTALKMPNGYEWTYMISCSDLSAKVSTVGTVTDVTVDHGDSVSGYAETVTVWGTKGSKSYTGAQFRSLLGLRSSNFDVMVEKSIAAKQYVSAEYVSSDSFATAFNVSSNMVTIQGKGYGHSVGMSQWSACVMADEGYDYRYILNYFYNQNSNNGRLVIRAY